MDASPELRSKKALIESFISGVNDIDDVMDVWHDYVIEMKEKDLVIIIQVTRDTKHYNLQIQSIFQGFSWDHLLCVPWIL